MSALGLSVPLTIVYLVVAVLTGLGQRRRTAATVQAWAAGCGWPLAWVIWYVRDSRRADTAS